MSWSQYFKKYKALTHQMRRSREPTRQVDRALIAKSKMQNRNTDVRRAHGQVTLVEFCQNLLRESPRLQDTSKRVNAIPSDHIKAASRKPNYEGLRSKVVAFEITFFFASRDAHRDCIDSLQPQRTTSLGSECIDADIKRLHTNMQPNRCIPIGDTDAVVSIKPVGAFRRVQIEAMTVIHDLQKNAAMGWLLRLEVKSAVPADMQEEVEETAAAIEQRFPRAKLPGFKHDYVYTHLYRVRSNIWFCDALIAAFLDRLGSEHEGARWPGTVQQIPARATRSAVMPRQEHKDLHS
ncbi:TPA: hypothetical protein N0F65_008733 [Lagenidium giganteum]|uniref:Uncharacterized protein n=1 Tax=Lagenidium giganteum TaxID=4803 RepID=A0AAV2YGA5_9STRA|nr:TPA: hypothetical protein N0F65_008733 [Lagenidium giganteum]